MKKIFKTLISFALITAMTTSLCSCVNIKEMRRSHGYYTDETRKTIIFNGKTYDRIEEWNDEIEVFLYEEGFVSEKEKPLLIANITGDTLRYNDAGIIIEADYNYYCLREEYENMQFKMKNMDFKNYCILNWYDSGLFLNIERKVIIIDDEYAEAINYVIENGILSKEEIEYFEESAEIYLCDDTKTFRKYFCVIGRFESNYYLSYYNEKTGEYKEYKIESPQVEILKKLIGEQIDEQLIVKK